MDIRRSDLPHCADLDGAVVVIDVLRSFTTAAVALARGASGVLAVGTMEEALERHRRDPEALTVGAMGGGRPAPGMDIGNSPSQIAAFDLRGRRVIQFTAGGTRGLAASIHAGMLLAGSLVCASATAAYLRALDPPTVTLVVTGMWTDRDGDEDHACADLIEALLRGDDLAREPFAERVRQSDFGRRFAAGDTPHLPQADLAWCAAVDRFDFAMPVERTAEGLVVRRGRPDEAGLASPTHP